LDLKTWRWGDIYSDCVRVIEVVFDCWGCLWHI
jgi:hypothetical protein